MSEFEEGEPLTFKMRLNTPDIINQLNSKHTKFEVPVEVSSSKSKSKPNSITICLYLEYLISTILDLSDIGCNDDY